MQSMGPLYFCASASCSLTLCVCNNSLTLSTGAAKDLLKAPLMPPEMKLEMNTEISVFLEEEEEEEEEESMVFDRKAGCEGKTAHFQAEAD